MKSINVIGLGYIGLPTAATLANQGFDVLGIDVRESIVEKINSGDIHIQEPGLDILVRAAFHRGTLRASTTPRPADVHIIAVPTPINPDKSPDLSFVGSAARTVAQVLKRGDLVVLESTVPPRTCECFIAPILREITHMEHSRDYHLAHCPERVIPGHILHEIIHNDRIIGGTTPEATQRTAEIYRTFVEGQILETDATTAEMCKLMENTFRDVNIALANELAAIAEEIGIDVHEAIQLANHHPRVNIHAPGIGVGGHCIPVDPWFIIHSAPNQAKLLRTARHINDERPHKVVQEIEIARSASMNKTIAIFGLSYKPDVDDVRESPAIAIVHLLAQNAPNPILVVEPHVEKLPPLLAACPFIQLVTAAVALQTCHVIGGLVAHTAFKRIDAVQLQNKAVIDAARIWT